MLDDNPLPAYEASSSVLVATYLHAPMQNGKGAIGGGKPSINGEFEKGLLTLITSDTPGLQVIVHSDFVTPASCSFVYYNNLFFFSLVAGLIWLLSPSLSRVLEMISISCLSQ